MSPRLLYLLTIGESRRRLAQSRDGFRLCPLSFADGDALTMANWRGYGAHAEQEASLRREERAAKQYAH